MPVVCLGLSHRTAPVDVRERHAFPAARMGEALVALRDYSSVREAAMLQTCGRIEIYAEVDDYELGVEQLKTFLGNFRHASVDYDLNSYLYTHLGKQAVDHLFHVSTGLDSMLIGEAEILGQVKDAYHQAHQARSLGASLHRLFREALNAGKSARAQTRIGDESTSIATAAIDAAKQRLGTLADTTVVVIGAGKMGRSAVRRLRQEGVAHLIVINRTSPRAQELVDEAGFGRAAGMPALAHALAEADVAIASTGASDFILTPTNVAAAMQARPHRPLFVVDIAVPRDADPEIASIDNVALVDVDGLRGIVDEKLEVRREAIPEVEEIIAEYVARYSQWYRSRLAVPVVASLTQKAEAIRAAEVERLLSRCPELTERERLLVVGMSMTVVSKLLHSVVTKIRDKAVSNHDEALSHARVLDELFELNLAEAVSTLVPHGLGLDVDDRIG
ncbi:MAG TPA: glutamyl-tRNA reductase [Candidatus Baltobacteraceae bacterium]